MTEFGYFLSCEEFGPGDLVEQARMAEDAGFRSLWISDHFHPWNDEQGESPFVWSVIGALSQVSGLPVETAVTCPTVRIHPALVAQAAATSQIMLDGRFRLGLGSGEALNEHILGDRWPPADVRLEMLEEAVAVIRQLFTGEEVAHHGPHYTVENARLYTLPATPPPIDVSAFGPKAADVASRIADGFVSTAPDAGLVSRFRARAPERPAYASTKVCWAETRETAVRTAHRLWAIEHLPGELGQILPTPRHFEQASELVTEQAVGAAVPCGPDPEEHARHLQEYVDAGFDRVHIGQIGPEQRGFFDFYRKEVLPLLAGADKSPTTGTTGHWNLDGADGGEQP
ncbi:TIGR03557 family F420-dependent LLM class oxidoreductase [Streptomyces sp. SKN60]|uniref:TIGR03557 family F420-dependent LLM class oxidoreductase n=1 Tax=Streptomyces sp. SKN60 TaxID=2855506 RepID=UPI00224587A3|nr:TIGR03557 family F420-dependent LLM class oxidoreductase [Streptomyces sp. SKN60]MCX2180116.1 TIGR03557 family F420-dependent LLM class oxidoreductase [Streptomyces sp. SKN60]